jgi:hypothetical protein
MVFPETRQIQDIDFHAVVKRPLTLHQKERIRQLHKRLAQELVPPGVELDGWYILSRDAQQVSPPRHQLYPDTRDNWWALHRAHIRAGYCITLRGEDLGQLFPAPTWSELVAALEAERRYIEEHLSEYPSYCVLNLCRLIYSYTTRDVVISKRTAAEWALDRFASWEHLITAALRVYEGAAEGEDRLLLESKTEQFYQFACSRIENRDAR